MPKDSHESFRYELKKKRKTKIHQCYSRTAQQLPKQCSSHKSKTQHHMSTESEDKKNHCDCNTIINALQHYVSWNTRTQS